MDAVKIANLIDDIEAGVASDGDIKALLSLFLESHENGTPLNPDLNTFVLKAIKQFLNSNQSLDQSFGIDPSKKIKKETLKQKNTYSRLHDSRYSQYVNGACLEVIPALLSSPTWPTWAPISAQNYLDQGPHFQQFR